MRNTKHVDEARRENTGCKRTSVDCAKLRVKTSDTHILELVVRLDDGVGCRPAGGRFHVETGPSILEERDLGMPRQNTPRRGVRLDLAGGKVCFLGSQI